MEKYGQCCDFNGNNCLKLKSPITSENQEFTFCAWVYRISDFFRVYSARTTTGGAGLFISVENNNIVFDDGTRFNPQMSFPERKWTHICLTRTSKEKKIYINGELVLSTNTVGNMEGISTTAFIGVSSENDKITGYTQGRLNDYRIYDHCLSDAEVKEISKGLVLHYTMDNIYGGSNLLLGSDRFSGAGGNASGITSSITENGELKVIASKGNGNWKTFAMSNNNGTIESIQNNMSVGDEFVISFDMKIESGSGIPTLFLNAGNSYERMIGNPNLIGKWQRVYKVRTWKEPRNIIIWLFKFSFGI